MSGTLIGYARHSTDTQDLTAQRQQPAKLDLTEEGISLDPGLTGINHKRPRLDQALAAVQAGDTPVAPRLNRLARSTPEPARSTTTSPPGASSSPSGRQIYDPTDPAKAWPSQQAKLCGMYASGDYSIADLAELFTLRLDQVGSEATARLSRTGPVTRHGDQYLIDLDLDSDGDAASAEDLVPDLIGDLVRLGVRVHARRPAARSSGRSPV